MTDDGCDTNLSALDDLLDAERAALLVGDLDLIARLTDRKAALIDALGQAQPRHHDALSDLSGKVARNQVLLDNALDGIRSVSRRLSVLRRVRQSLDTYDEQGAKRSIDIHPEGSVEKRA